MGRIIGIDYGRARIGIAFSDERHILASPLDVFSYRQSKEKLFGEIQKRLEGLGGLIESFVIGLPLLLDGKEGEMAKEARSFGEKISLFFSLPCIFWDERLSSCFAERMMKEGLMSRKERAKKSDTFAATLILQNYLDYLERNHQS